MRRGSSKSSTTLITDAGSRLYKTLARVQEASMRKADSEDWRGLLERLEKVKAAE